VKDTRVGLIGPTRFFTMTLTSLMSTDLDWISTGESNTFRATLVWGAQTVYGTRTEFQDADDVAVIGNSDRRTAEWFGTVADFTDNTLPGERATVTVDGIECVVEQSIPDEANVGVRLRLAVKL